MLLGVNIDHVATLRQARHTTYPDLLKAAKLAIAGGADSITVHLREDRRHIQDDDVRQLKSTLPVPLNLEMALTDAMIDFALEIQPDYICLVPEKREELTTEGGLDVIKYQSGIADFCLACQHANIQTSCFIEAETQQIDAANKAGCHSIELHTGHYAESVGTNQTHTLEKIKAAATHGKQQQLQINAGHGLHLNNLTDIVTIDHITELNIGHSIIARAIFVGLEQAVLEVRNHINKHS